jgi:hypothetical protein
LRCSPHRSSQVAHTHQRDSASLDEFKASGILQILTPAQAIAHFTAMRERIPVEHFMMMKPPGLPAERFLEYSDVFARGVIPAFQ